VLEGRKFTNYFHLVTINVSMIIWIPIGRDVLVSTCVVWCHDGFGDPLPLQWWFLRCQNTMVPAHLDASCLMYIRARPVSSCSSHSSQRTHSLFLFSCMETIKQMLFDKILSVEALFSLQLLEFVFLMIWSTVSRHCLMGCSVLHSFWEGWIYQGFFMRINNFFWTFCSGKIYFLG
jgi:hypothetical protein